MFTYPPPMLILSAALLLAFGAIYNVIVDALERNGYAEGYVSILVVGGVAVTLLIVAILEWRAALLVFLAFCCSGFPMVIGSIYRHVRRREHGQDAQRREVLDD